MPVNTMQSVWNLVSQNVESYPAMIWECPQTKPTRSELYYYIYLGGEQTN